MSFVREPSAVNIGTRIDQYRSMATSHKSGGADTLHNTEANAAATEGTAVWGTPVWVFGYDMVLLLMDFTQGTTTTGFGIRAQVAAVENDEAVGNDSLWYDLYIQQDDMTPLQWALDFTTGTTKVAIPVLTHGARWMRFRAWAPGSNQANSRIVLTGIRNKLGV